MRLGKENHLWFDIAADAYIRMDKFLYLVRVYLQAGFSHFATKTWKDEDQLEKYLVVLEETPFNPRDHRIPDGMRYHCLDVYVDELDRIDEKKEGNLPIQKLLRPIRTLGSKTLSKTVRARVKETLEDERLKAWLGEGNGEGEDEKESEKENAAQEDNEWGGIED
jgi:ribosomal RNA-processing protein 1